MTSCTLSVIPAYQLQVAPFIRVGGWINKYMLSIISTIAVHWVFCHSLGVDRCARIAKICRNVIRSNFSIH